MKLVCILKNARCTSGYSTDFVASLIGKVLHGLSSHNMPAQHAHHSHQNVQHMGAAYNQLSPPHAQQSQPVHPPADHKSRRAFASKPSPEDLFERDSIQRNESRQLLSGLSDFVDLQIPLVEKRLQDGRGELKSSEDDGNDLNIFMAEIVTFSY